MADSSEPAATSSAKVGRRTFSVTFRGFDRTEVTAYLKVVADEFAKLQARVATLESELAAALTKPVVDPLDVEALTEALGEETANVLRTAREAADELRTRAEQGAARALREAQEEATRIRTSAETVFSERSAVADQAAERVLQQSEEEAAKLREQATAEVDAKIAQAITEGRDMVGQAQAAHERVLGDLARRREAALRQLEAIRAGRERLLASFEDARSEIDRLMEDLDRSDAEARRAAELASQTPRAVTAAAPALPPVEELEAADASADDEGAADAEPGPDDAVELAPAAEAAPDDATHSPDQDLAADATPSGDQDVADNAAPADGAGPAAPAGQEGPAAVDPTPPASPETATQPGPEVIESTVEDDAAPVVATMTGTVHDPVPAVLLPNTGRVDQLFARIRADKAMTTVPPPPVVPLHAPPAPPPPPSPPPPEAREARDSQEASDVPAVSAVAVETVAAPAQGDLESPRSDVDELYLQQRDGLLEGPVAAAGRALKRALADDQNTLLERLRTSHAPLLDDVATQVQTWTRHVTPSLLEAAAGGARMAGVDDPPAGPITARVAEIARGMSAEMIGPLREKLDAVLTDGGADMADRINAAFREWRGRIDRLVGDAMTNALAVGFVAGLEPGASVRWIVDDIDGPCPDCDDNALAGVLTIGEPFPTGQTQPPAHPGCRCILAHAAAT